MKIFRYILEILFLPIMIPLWIITMLFCGIFKVLERFIYNADFYWEVIPNDIDY